ncbi:hypothetical protein GA0070624_6188 [Micromonospora rhizosphaerae]|uniref:Uncharacterized protein n=1 Tax=Micromonospora rhizosphaerae TaxID=568872 RepID=A0A1C6TA58_9ACTN|nr:hypothetical protein [Micromonospora rhizosphaerae]SCL38355.1 hypothetical protein GA0070624_6188 [Micromonospora rhizosphaerae]
MGGEPGPRARSPRSGCRRESARAADRNNVGVEGVTINKAAKGAKNETCTIADSGNQAGATSLIATSYVTDVVVTAVRTGGGHLKMITWNVSNDGTFGRLDEASVDDQPTQLAISWKKQA